MSVGGWRDDDLALQWAGGDRLGAILHVPRRIVAELLAGAEPPPARVLDVGSGPGALLAAILERNPAMSATWTDVSPAMLEIAGQRLAPFEDRVDYRIADATDVASLGAAGTYGAVVTSRMTHHLDPAERRAFYAAAVRLVGPGGWIANLDHVTVDEPWAGRLAAARSAFVAPNPSPHHHDRPHPTVDEHRRDLAGLEVTVAWQAFTTVLIVARVPA
jgi:SAM-dependent methyltransferase